MNERIHELAKKARQETALYGGKPGGKDFDKRFVERFAELIVLECSDSFGCEGHGRFDVDGNWIARTIKHHFGVDQ